jgi:peptidyl-prolyl cis-trans isomerase B (cyclophilin B)
MARSSRGRSRVAGFAAAITLSIGLSGCGKPAGPPEPSASSTTTTTTAPVTLTVPADKPTPSEPARDPLHQSFADATRAADNPPEDSQRPPDRTITGKPVFKLLAEVQKQWDSIRFVTADGRKLEYTALFDTTHGALEITLLSEAAPNHVRNFVALARAGYYDGLRFDGILHEAIREDPEAAPMRLDQLRAGCPLGTGETGTGSLGYWLRPEFNARQFKLTHEEGTVGACHGPEPDSAATRFYINLTPAPYLDDSYTIFGKVSKGLDVLRTIGVQPVRIDEGADGDSGHQPLKPIVIRSVKIQTRTAGAGTEGKR